MGTEGDVKEDNIFLRSLRVKRLCCGIIFLDFEVGFLRVIEMYND